MRMSLRMKKCWMKKEGPDSNWRHVFHHTSVCDCVCYLYISGHLEGPDSVCDGSEFVSVSSQVENTIRWRVKRDEEGIETRESNARIVKWSDGRWASRRCGRCWHCTVLWAGCAQWLDLCYLQHVPPPGERSVWRLQSSSSGRPQPPVHPTGYWTAGTGRLQDQADLQVMDWPLVVVLQRVWLHHTNHSCVSFCPTAVVPELFLPHIQSFWFKP